MTLHQPTPLPEWEHGAASEQGSRHEQQDRWGIFHTPTPPGWLAIVADGMGGHQDGALGAQIAVDTAHQFVERQTALLHTDPALALTQLCQQIHHAINQQSAAARSTVVMAWLDSQHRVYWLNIGDSRLYHLRKGQRMMRTRDHSAVQLLVDLGEIEEAQIASHPAQNHLYRCLGGTDNPKPDSGYFNTQPGDLLALCSDGVWEYVTETELWETSLTNSPAIAARALTTQAVQRGGDMADNATLLLLRASGEAAISAPWLQGVSGRLSALFRRHLS